jgi:hypothetical protein
MITKLLSSNGRFCATTQNLLFQLPYILSQYNREEMVEIEDDGEIT